jgi:hypothetical protein
MNDYKERFEKQKLQQIKLHRTQETMITTTKKRGNDSNTEQRELNAHNNEISGNF